MKLRSITFADPASCLKPSGKNRAKSVREGMMHGARSLGGVLLLVVVSIFSSCTSFSADVFTQSALDQGENATILYISYNEALLAFDEAFVEYNFKGKISSYQLGEPGREPEIADLASGEALPALYYISPGKHNAKIRLYGDMREAPAGRGYVRHYKPHADFVVVASFEAGKTYHLQYDKSFGTGLPKTAPKFVEKVN